ncbi:MAG: hypothetical protein HQ509_10625 [Candidatus Marinimicrobia bacterium]|nr:hypothetical protein [Candidatus Neomarinimicrobiota bacterium]
MGKRYNIFSNHGTTLIETAAVMSVVGIAIVGLSLGYYNIVTQYESDTVRNNLVSFGNTFINEIAKNLVEADSVDYSGTSMGYAKIIFSNDEDIIPYLAIQVSADGSDFIVSPESAEIAELSIPNRGDYIDSGKRTVKIERFEADANTDVRPSMRNFNSSMVTIILEFEIISKKLLSGEKPKEYVTIERAIFMPKKYIGFHVP